MVQVNHRRASTAKQLYFGRRQHLMDADQKIAPIHINICSVKR
jgi:hypothetical protein